MAPWMGDYQELHFGAGGGTVDQVMTTVGASHMYAGLERDRGAYSRGPERGLAASLPRALRGVLAGDGTHEPLLDGWAESAVARHPDFQFQQGTAHDSYHSVSSNYAALKADPRASPYVGLGGTYDARAHEFIELNAPGKYAHLPATLKAQRADRLYDAPELLVKAPTEGGTRFGSFFSRDLSASDLGLGALGLWAAASVF